LKRQLLVSAIVTLLLFSVLLFVPVKATASIPTWSMPRPTTTREFNSNVSNAVVSSDGECALTLGVNVWDYARA
jgi:hypothetical protein